MPLMFVEKLPLPRLRLARRRDGLLDRFAVLDHGSNVARDRFEIALLGKNRVGPRHRFGSVAGDGARRLFLHQIGYELQPSDDRAVECRDVIGKQKIAEEECLGRAVEDRQIVVGVGGWARLECE